MEIPPGLARKRRSTAGLREELEPNKKKTQETVAGETRNVMGNQEQTQPPIQDELLPDPSLEGSASGQGGYLGKLEYARAGAHKAEGPALNWVEQSPRQRRRVYCCVCDKDNASGERCNVCGHVRCAECLIKNQ
jgi:hypothetical protein